MSTDYAGITPTATHEHARTLDALTTADNVGALNLYATETNAFDQDARDLGYTFAAHAAIVWSGLRRGEVFHSALARRDVISQAKGILMQRYGLGAAQAFELLHGLTVNSGERLIDVAREVVTAHQHE